MIECMEEKEYMSIEEMKDAMSSAYFKSKRKIMALFITDTCINYACPNQAFYEPDAFCQIRLFDGHILCAYNKQTFTVLADHWDNAYK
jgi:hypothetical protein